MLNFCSSDEVIDSDEYDKVCYELGDMHDIRYNQLFGIKTGA
jgi:hypothetical protein